MSIDAVFRELGLCVFERGWLSSNNVLFAATGAELATLVDSGYSSHAEQTLSLVRAALGPVSLGRLVNTHLHSDHCGGNSRLHAAYGCEIWVPEPSFETVRRWDERELTYGDTGQRCDRYPADRALAAGSVCRMGSRDWSILSAPGHDPDAVMLFEPVSRVLITGDALWEDRLAIIFPEFEGAAGFAAARHALEAIEVLDAAVVIPGHGRPFTDVAGALARSRRRLAQFEADPGRHFQYGARALTMFHMLEHRSKSRPDLIRWLTSTPIFARLHCALSVDGRSPEAFAETLLDSMLRDGLLSPGEGQLTVIER